MYDMYYLLLSSIIENTYPKALNVFNDPLGNMMFHCNFIHIRISLLSFGLTLMDIHYRRIALRYYI